MLIDSDSNFNTGKGGFDYRYRIVWNDGTWYEILEELPTLSIKLKEVSKNEINSTFDANSIKYHGTRSSLEMSLDLEKIGSPQRYVVVFFTEGHVTNEPFLIQDVLSLAVIPPPAFDVNTNPDLISFESSTEKIIHIIIKSDITETTDLYYNVYSDSDSVKIKRLIDNSISLKEGKAEIPILLFDEGHPDLKIHKLFVDLNPWYPVNPETKSAEPGSEIFETYHFRNKQKAETFTLFWSSLPQKPFIDTPLLIQIILLSATIIMAIFGIWTHLDNRRFGNQERKIKHTNEMAKVYETLLSLTSIRDYYSKELVLRFPPDKNDQRKIRDHNIDPQHDGSIELVNLNQSNLLYLGRAIKHLKNYDKLFVKWSSLNSSVVDYNQTVSSIKHKIEFKCFKRIKEELPEFKEFTGEYAAAFFIDSIVDEAYEILVDLIKDQPHQPILQNVFPWNPDDDNDNRNLYVIKGESPGTLFQSPKPMDESSVDKILNSSTDDELKTEMKQLSKIFEKVQSELYLFKQDLEPLIRKLQSEDLIKGKCDLKI